MGFRGHLLGGLALGTLAAEAAVRAGQVPAGDSLVWSGVCAATVFASLLPDLDTSSVPQRWFFRAILAALLGLAFRGRYDLATGLAVVSLLPLLDHHRGWTHGRYAPLLVLPSLALIFALVRTHGEEGCILLCSREAGSGLAVLLLASLPYVVAATGGWYLHLLLDGMFSVLPVDGGHR